MFHTWRNIYHQLRNQKSLKNIYHRSLSQSLLTNICHQLLNHRLLRNLSHRSFHHLLAIHQLTPRLHSTWVLSYFSIIKLSLVISDCQLINNNWFKSLHQLQLSPLNVVPTYAATTYSISHVATFHGTPALNPLPSYSNVYSGFDTVYNGHVNSPEYTVQQPIVAQKPIEPGEILFLLFAIKQCTEWLSFSSPNTS